MQSTSPHYSDRRKPIVLWTLGIIAAANGVWMLAEPAAWFATIPGVTNTGPFNVHLFCDVGCTYLTMAVAMLVAAWTPRAGFSVMLVVGTFMLLHALLHVWDILVGRLPHSHALTDLPGVFLPAVLCVAITAWLYADWREHPTPAHV